VKVGRSLRVKLISILGIIKKEKKMEEVNYEKAIEKLEDGSYIDMEKLYFEYVIEKLEDLGCISGGSMYDFQAEYILNNGLRKKSLRGFRTLEDEERMSRIRIKNPDTL
jgi:hypothetical protein